MDKRTFKICEAVHLGLDYYYMGKKDRRTLTKEDYDEAQRILPTLHDGWYRERHDWRRRSFNKEYGERKMAEATTEANEEKLSFTMDDEEFWTRKGVMKEMKIGATTLAKEIRIGNITPNIFTFGYGFPKASVR